MKPHSITQNRNTYLHCVKLAGCCQSHIIPIQTVYIFVGENERGHASGVLQTNVGHSKFGYRNRKNSYDLT